MKKVNITNMVALVERMSYRQTVRMQNAIESHLENNILPVKKELAKEFERDARAKGFSLGEILDGYWPENVVDTTPKNLAGRPPKIKSKKVGKSRQKYNVNTIPLTETFDDMDHFGGRMYPPAYQHPSKPDVVWCGRGNTPLWIRSLEVNGVMRSTFRTEVGIERDMRLKRSPEARDLTL